MPITAFPSSKLPCNWILSRSPGKNQLSEMPKEEKKIWRNDYYSTIRFQLQGRGGVKWTSSHIKVYRRPLALGDFVESSHVLTHILTRGQVTLFDYYNRSHRFGVQALSSRSRLRTTSMEKKNLLVWNSDERKRDRDLLSTSGMHGPENQAVCVCVTRLCCISLIHKTHWTDSMTEWTWGSV